MVLLAKELHNIWSITVAVILVTLIGLFMTSYSTVLENVVNKILKVFVRAIISYHYGKISHKIDMFIGFLDVMKNLQKHLRVKVNLKSSLFPVLEYWWGTPSFLNPS